MRKRTGKATLVIATTVALAVAIPLQGASAGEPSPAAETPPGSSPAPLTVELDTALPSVPADLMTWATATQAALVDEAAFLTVRISDDRESAQVFWHGDPTPELTAVLEEAPTTYGIEITQTAYLPGDLREAARELLATGSISGQEVTATWPNPDGTGVSATIAPPAGRQARLALPSEIDGIPLDVSQGDVTEARGRQDDDLHLGGARINRVGGGACTLGFAASSPTIGDGGIFASHCGNPLDQWARPSATGTWFGMGQTTHEVDGRDGAMLTGTYFNPAMYVGSYTSAAYVSITGTANPVQNTEICYSGSYSGLNCGNLVSVPYYNYSLAGVGAIEGFRTANVQGYPAIGNGDSGGPGIVPVSAPNGGSYLWAAAIISAMPSNNKSATCAGVPGTGPVNSTNPADRQCSPIAIATRAVEIADQFFVKIKTVSPN